MDFLFFASNVVFEAYNGEIFVQPGWCDNAKHQPDSALFSLR